MNRSLTSLFVVLALAALILSGCTPDPVVSQTMTDYIDATQTPYQENLEDEDPMERTIDGINLSIQPVAYYEISAVVLSTKSYSRGWQGELAPRDLALAWGELSDPANREHIKFKQRNRWYYYKYTADFPHDVNFIIHQSANNHIIPATDNIRYALETIEEGDKIYIEGYLVRILGHKEGQKYWWHSSTRRDDSGDGSCEIIYTEKLRVNKNLYL
jgi:hypothetical protein